MTTAGATGVTATVTLTTKKSAASDPNPLTPLNASRGVEPTGMSARNGGTKSERTATTNAQQDRDVLDALGAQGAVALRGETVALNSPLGSAFVIDCARNIEGALSDAEAKAKYGLSEKDWTALASNSALLAAVRSERERRLLSGEAAREAAQRHFANAPGVLNSIMNDEQAPPRHRIEAARELRQAAAGGPEIAPTPKEKFTITINLGSATEVYEKFIDPRGPLLVDDGEAS